jgi:hypothetical protein
LGIIPTQGREGEKKIHLQMERSHSSENHHFCGGECTLETTSLSTFEDASVSLMEMNSMLLNVNTLKVLACILMATATSFLQQSKDHRETLKERVRERERAIFLLGWKHNVDDGETLDWLCVVGRHVTKISTLYRNFSPKECHELFLQFTHLLFR